MTDEDRKDAETGAQDQPEAEAAAPAAEPTEEPAATSGEPSEPEAEGGAAAEEEPEAAEEPPEWTPPPPDDLNVFDMLRAAIGLFVQEAWIALGVQARPGAIDVRTDLHCARIAIDTTQLLIEKLGDEATGEERREFEQLMTDLRMNFVRRQAKQG